MDKLIYLLPVLACAGMMGAMMWMMRGHHSAAPSSPDTAAEIAALRNEIAALRTAQAGERDTTPAAPVDAAPTGMSVR